MNKFILATKNHDKIYFYDTNLPRELQLKGTYVNHIILDRDYLLVTSDVKGHTPVDDEDRKGYTPTDDRVIMMELFLLYTCEKISSHLLGFDNVEIYHHEVLHSAGKNKKFCLFVLNHWDASKSVKLLDIHGTQTCIGSYTEWLMSTRDFLIDDVKSSVFDFFNPGHSTAGSPSDDDFFYRRDTNAVMSRSGAFWCNKKMKYYANKEMFVTDFYLNVKYHLPQPLLPLFFSSLDCIPPCTQEIVTVMVKVSSHIPLVLIDLILDY